MNPQPSDTKTVSKKIEITCKASRRLSIDLLLPFQKGLKTIDDANLAKLKRQIIKNGMNVPVFVWANKDKFFMLDGHQRVTALKSLRDEGYKVPPVPVAFIQAKNARDAKSKLLAIVSQYGRITPEGLITFSSGIDIQALFPDLRIVDTELEMNFDNVFEEWEDFEKSYKDPDKDRLQCPKCGHVDGRRRFKIV